MAAVLPQQPLPASVWTYPVPGESPAGPLLSPQGLLCTDNVTGGAGGAFLRSVELETGQVQWSYDVRPESELTSVVIPAAVGSDGQTAYVGVQSPYKGTSLNFVEIHAVSVATGTPVWQQPAHLTPATAFLTRPVVLAGTLYAGVEGLSSGGLAWGDPASGTMQARFFSEAQEEGAAQFMTEPVVDATSVYVGRNAAATPVVAAETLVTAFAADLRQWTVTWQVTLPSAITADLALGASTLFIPTGGTIVALNTADGSVKWSHQLSGSPVQGRPVVIGSTLCVGSTDGTLYALDTAAGTEQWRVDIGSPIATGLVNEDSVLYFATAGDGVGTAPAFIAVDANSQGNDVLAYPIPDADTILFAQGGVTNGVVYFYGAQNVYAVNMSNVIREFAVTSKLIVENYTTTGTSTPTGNDTSYRVTLSIRDENGAVRANQPVKLWSPGTLYVVNQASPVTLTSEAPVWMQTDASGNLTLAVSAFDDGTPAGTPNVACSPLFAWANFMSAGEAIVIYPDQESLGTLANVQGSSSSASAARADTAVAGPAPQFLDQATAYDGSPLILSSYQDPASLDAIASTVRNTVGTRNTGTVGASYLTAGRHPAAKYVRRGAVVPNVVYAADAPRQRPAVRAPARFPPSPSTSRPASRSSRPAPSTPALPAHWQHRPARNRSGASATSGTS